MSDAGFGWASALKVLLPAALAGGSMFFLGRSVERLEQARAIPDTTADAAVVPAAVAAEDAKKTDANADAAKPDPPSKPQGKAQGKGQRPPQSKPQTKDAAEKKASAGAAGAGGGWRNKIAPATVPSANPNAAVAAAGAPPAGAPLRRVVCAEALSWLRAQSWPLTSACANVPPPPLPPGAGDPNEPLVPNGAATGNGAAAPLEPWVLPGGVELAAAIITSVPDVCETGMSLGKWKVWFVDACATILRALHPDGVAVFYQTDIKRDGVWVDKSHLVNAAADTVPGVHLLFHKIVVCNQIGTVKGKTASYTHMLCYGKHRRSDGSIVRAPPPPHAPAAKRVYDLKLAKAARALALASGTATATDADADALTAAVAGAPAAAAEDAKEAEAAATAAADAAAAAAAAETKAKHLKYSKAERQAFAAGVRASDALAAAEAAARKRYPVQATPDIIAARGRMTWVRAMGLHACYVACRYVLHATNLRVVVDPFCGRGSVLAVANDLGLHAVGVDWSPKRCRYAQELTTSADEYDSPQTADDIKQQSVAAGRVGSPSKRKTGKRDDSGQKRSAAAAAAAAAGVAAPAAPAAVVGAPRVAAAATAAAALPFALTPTPSHAPVSADVAAAAAAGGWAYAVATAAETA